MVFTYIVAGLLTGMLAYFAICCVSNPVAKVVAGALAGGAFLGLIAFNTQSFYEAVSKWEIAQGQAPFSHAWAIFGMVTFTTVLAYFGFAGAAVISLNKQAEQPTNSAGSSAPETLGTVSPDADKPARPEDSDVPRNNE